MRPDHRRQPRPAAAGRSASKPTRNKAASPYRYEIDPDDLLRLTIATDDADEVFWGIVHSHTHTPAVPSPTDIGLAFYPDALYLLVSLVVDQACSSAAAPARRGSGRGASSMAPSRAARLTAADPREAYRRRSAALAGGTVRSTRYPVDLRATHRADV